jgi:voltage-gated potassium channel
MQFEKPDDKWPAWKNRLNRIIFGTDTFEGKMFDVVLMIIIVLSVLVVFLDSIHSVHQSYGRILLYLEWFFTIVFTIEYILRIISLKKPFKYIFNFYGVIDLLSFLPTYLSLFIAGGQLLIVIRVFRLLRIFRVFKLGRYLGASSHLYIAIRNSRHKITVFLWFVLIIVTIMGAVMYLIEGPENGFANIPDSIYWAIVTLTTVGYGDISPQTGLGKAIASIIMIIGYGIIAVPTGIFTAEMTKSRLISAKSCQYCLNTQNDPDAGFCKICGKPLVKDTDVIHGEEHN